MPTATQQTVTGILRQSLTVCLVDRDPNYLNLAKSQIERAGFPVVAAVSSEEALQKIRRGACRVVLADLGMPDMDGLTLLERAVQHDPEICVILTTGAYSAEAAIGAIKCGAYDYLPKPLDFPRLEGILDELAEIFSQRAEVRLLEGKLHEIQPFQGMAGKSPAILEVFDLAKRLAHLSTDVLISGPAGVGKKRIARALHDFSAAAREPFTVCNCPSLADALLESQLLAGQRMSLDAATRARKQVPDRPGGTFFIEEIAETSLSTQARLLAAIRSRDVSRSEPSGFKKGNLRIIAATSRSLRAEVLAGCFREDFFARLSAVEIRVPAIAERPEDIPVLAHHFLKEYNQAHGKRLQGVSRRAQIALLRHDWPGNVREIENVITLAAAVAQGDWVDLGDLPEHVRTPHRRAALPSEGWQPAPLEEMRRIHIERMLAMCNGNRVRAARILGIGRTSLYRFLKRSARQAEGARVTA